MDRLNPLFPDASRARGALLAAALLCLGLLGMGAPSRAEAGTPVTLFKSFSGNLNFVTTGGTRRTQPNTGNNCTVVADTASTNMTLPAIPAGSTVVAAYLYWAGSGSLDANVTFNGNNITADRTFTDNTGNAYFSGFKDVTSMVTASTSPTVYTFANITIDNTTACGTSAVLDAYAMFVIYSNPSEDFRVLNVFDGFQLFQGSSITLTPNNFQIPSSPINGKFAVITWEGDFNVNTTLGGFSETLKFNNNILTDTCDPNGNQYNSTINTITCTANENTNGGIYWGLDFDTYDISSYLTAGDTSASTFYSSGQDLVFLSAQIVSVTNTPVSDLSITASDGAASVQAGSNTSYTLTVKNNGPNTTVGTTTVTFAIDTTNETYVSASGTGWTCGFVSPNVTCTRSDALTNGSTYPTISVTTTMKTTASGTVTDTASVTGGNFDNVSGNSSGITDSDTVTYPSDDLTISKTHSGNFSAGANASYTITVTNNGPIAIPTGTTTTVSDTLPAGETFVSGTGTGWSCSAVGQAVTCTSTTSAASGASLPAISLNVTLSQGIGVSVSNTATVSNAFISDGTAGNNSSTNVATVTQPNYSTSTKTWVDLNGGDVNPGDTVEYTITVKDTAAAAGFNIEVTDNMPSNISSFSLVSIPGGATNASTGTGTGANGTGFLDITGINVSASGTATIVFDVVVSGSAAPGDAIDNTATVVGGTAAATPTATTITVQQSSVPASGNKILYVYDAQTLTRTPQTTNTTGITVNEASTLDWTLSPAFQKAFTLSAGNVTVALMSARSGGNTNRTFFVELLKNGSISLGTSASTAAFNSTTLTLRTLTVNVAATSFAAGDTLVLRVHNTSAGSGTRTILVAQMSGGTKSTITFATPTVINVDSVTMYNAAYNSTSTPPNNIFEPNTTVYIRAIVSDPFGSYDIDPVTGGTAPTYVLKDPNGTTQASGNLTQVADSGAATKTFEVSYAIPNGAVEGFWTPTVTATEGTEGTVTHTANGSFEMRRPSLVVTKLVTVLSDPTNGGTRPKSIPGATEQYSIQVSNAGKGRANAVVITDAIPTNTTYVTGSVTFVDGSPTSGLAAPTVTWDNTSCAGAFAAAESTSAKCIKFAWTNANFMNGSTGSSPSFIIRFNVTVN